MSTVIYVQRNEIKENEQKPTIEQKYFDQRDKQYTSTLGLQSEVRSFTFEKLKSVLSKFEIHGTSTSSSACENPEATWGLGSIKDDFVVLLSMLRSSSY